MKQSNIDIKIQGVRGGKPSYTENKGYVNVFIDGEDNSISVDAFTGFGEKYKRRDKSLITIKTKDGKVWTGDFETLANNLF